MNTRKTDLEILEAGRDQSDSARIHRTSLIQSVYEQSKDTTLEAMRLELQNWIIKGLEAVPEGDTPTLRQKMAMAEAEINIERMEKAIKQYTSSEAFQRNIASKVAKISQKEAEIVLKGRI